MTEQRPDNAITQKSIEDRCKLLSDNCIDALGEDIDNDEYAEVKYVQGQLDIIESWNGCNVGILQMQKMNGYLDTIEDFIVNFLPKGEIDA